MQKYFFFLILTITAVNLPLQANPLVRNASKGSSRIMSQNITQLAYRAPHHQMHFTNLSKPPSFFNSKNVGLLFIGGACIEANNLRRFPASDHNHHHMIDRVKDLYKYRPSTIAHRIIVAGIVLVASPVYLGEYATHQLHDIITTKKSENTASEKSIQDKANKEKF